MLRESEIHVREVDEDGHGRSFAADAADQPAVLGVDIRRVTHDLGDAHVGDVFGADDAVEAGGLHLSATEAKAGQVGHTSAELGDDLRAVLVSAGFAGREEDCRIGWGNDRTSVDFLKEI